jgi:hypothetical protein
MAQQEAAKDYSGLCNRFYIKLDLHQPIFLRCGQDCYIKSFRRVITADTVPRRVAPKAMRIAREEM